MNWITIGSILGAIGVAAGAFGAHGLKARLEPDMLAVFEVGVRYQMYHALALVAVGILSRSVPGMSTAGWFFFVGTLLFSGSLYALSLTGLKFFGPITPLGGLLLIIGWIALAQQSLGNA